MSDLYKDKKNWDKIIEPDSVNSLKAFKELIDYKELYYRLVRRDFTIFYKQTILIVMVYYSTSCLYNHIHNNFW